MKTILLHLSILPLLFSTAPAFSQSNYPFPDSEAIWNTVGDNMFTHHQFRFRYGMFGDTIINDQLYKKIYELYDTTLVHPNSTYFCALRVDGDQVFMLSDFYPELVLYDFSLAVGDTIWYPVGGGATNSGQFLTMEPHWKKVAAIDTVQVENGDFRKRWFFESEYFIDIWVEGIGSVYWAGLFNPLITDIITNGDSYYFACLKHDNEVVYQENPFCDKCFCQLLAAVDNVNKNQKAILHVYPNPGDDIIYIDLGDQALKGLKLVILNPVGVAIKEIIIGENPVVEISVKNLNSGMYSINILDEKRGLMGSGKFIVK